MPTTNSIPTTDPRAGDPQKILRVINNSETDTATVEGQFSRKPGTPIGPEKPTPNFQNNPIPGIDVVVKKQPTGGKGIPTSKTDGNGQTTFRQLEPGNYEVVLPKIPGGGAVSMTTFVNGTLASRTDFPIGSSVGTFTVGSARDSITLKFESTTGATPSNGIGGQGGGRYTFK